MFTSSTSTNLTIDSVRAFNSEINTLSISQRVFISDEVFNIFFVAAGTVFTDFLSLLGTVSNLINTVIYYKQGLKDSVTVSYMALSFWDACMCFLTLISVIFVTIERLFTIRDINLMAVNIVCVSYTRSVTHIMTTLITVFLSVELCVCITMPLKVKLIFTKSRSLVIHFVMVIFTLTCNCPTWATQGLLWQFDPRFNHTRLRIWLAQERLAVDMFMSIFTANIVQVTAQVLSVVCAILLVSGIKRSARFRMQSARKPNTLKESLTPKSSDSLQTISDNVATKQSPSRSKEIVKSHIKLAKITVMITILFLVFNIPVMVVSLSKTMVPGLVMNVNLISLLYLIVYVSTTMNSNISIFVYYNGSKKFKSIFRSLAHIKSR